MADDPEIKGYIDPSLPPGLPFSSAIKAGGFVYVSGQIGNVPGTMELVPGGIEAEARRMLDNLKAVLALAGTSPARVVKCTVYFADLADFQAFNAVYRNYFTAPLPARTAIEAKLVLGARCEIDCVALA